MYVQESENDILKHPFKNVDWKRFMIGNLVGLVYLGIIVGTNFAYKDPLYDESIDLMWDRTSDPDTAAIMNYLGYGAHLYIIYLFGFIFI